IGVITDDDSAFAEMRLGLLPTCRATQASDESSIKHAVEDAERQAILVDLDSIGESARDGFEGLHDIRNLRYDIVLVAITQSKDHSIPLRASQAGADEIVLKPVNPVQLQDLIARAIEKRALEMEGRRIVLQAESRSVFYSLVGASAAMQKLYQTIQA